MFDLTEVSAALTANSPSLQQIVLPANTGESSVNTLTLLKSLIDAAVSSRVYARLPDRPVYPCAVIELLPSAREPIDGYDILTVEEYSVAILDQDVDQAVSSAAAVKTALLAYNPSNAAGAASINSVSAGDNLEIGLYQIEISVQFVHLSLASQALPMAFVYPGGEDAVSQDRLISVDVDETTRFSVLAAAKIPANGVSALSSLTTEIRTAVLGIVDEDWTRIRWNGTDIVGVFNRLVLMRDDFSIRHPASFL